MTRFLAFLTMIIAGQAVALDATDVKLIDRFGIVKSKMTDVRLHEDGDWKVDPSKMDIDEYEYGHSEFKDLTNWKKIKEENWFDLNKWIESRKLKDKTPAWRTYLRNKRNAEISARVLKCIGVCRYFQETRGNHAHYMSVLREGDEFITEPHSSAWITLIDGTLLRVAPDSSVTFIEINLTKKKVFQLLRLNYGYIHTQSRLGGEFEVLNKSETDLGFYPLMIKAANREYYAMKEFRAYSDYDQMIYGITENAGHISQYNKLNEHTKMNAEYMQKIDSQLVVFTPNTTVDMLNSHLQMFYAINGKTHFKVSKNIPFFKQDNSKDQSNRVALRGYTNREKEVALDNQWYEVDARGTILNQNDDLGKVYGVMDGFTNRIPTIQLAREIFFNQYTKKLFHPTLKKDDLAKDHLYYLWNQENELSKREKFLDEYIRRTETTNVKVLAKVFKDVEPKAFQKSYYQKAMEGHYRALRKQYSEAQLAVRELNDNEYYLWLIKHAK